MERTPSGRRFCWRKSNPGDYARLNMAWEKNGLWYTDWREADRHHRKAFTTKTAALAFEARVRGEIQRPRPPRGTLEPLVAPVIRAKLAS